MTTIMTQSPKPRAKIATHHHRSSCYHSSPGGPLLTPISVVRHRFGLAAVQLLLLLLLLAAGPPSGCLAAPSADNAITYATSAATADVGQHQPVVAATISSMEPIYQLHQYVEPSAARNGANASSGCHLERGCLLCGADDLCAKCVHFITADDRRCVLECPRGYIEQWSNSADLLGIVCQPNGYADPMLATIVSLTVGACACLLLVIGGVLAIRRQKRQKCTRAALIDDTVERDDFLKQLDELRPSAEYFLAMLNDTRRQIRKLFLAGDQPGANAYRTIVRDLAKVLILLNRPVELIARPPHDWPRVYSWARRILDRCRPQMVQLIEFLQSPAGHAGSHSTSGGGHHGDDRELMMGSSQYSTFKSTHTGSTMAPRPGGGGGSGADSPDAKRRLQLFGSLISLHELQDGGGGFGERMPAAGELHPTNPFRSSCGTLKAPQASGSGGHPHHHHPAYPPSDVHGSSMWLEDEFFKLGFRPQDEITTEL